MRYLTLNTIIAFSILKLKNRLKIDPAVSFMEECQPFCHELIESTNTDVHTVHFIIMMFIRITS